MRKTASLMLALALLAGCSGPFAPTPAVQPPPPIVGPWAIAVNGSADAPALYAFAAGELLVTTESGIGTWRAMPAADMYEATFHIPVDATAVVRVSFVVTVHGDDLAGSGLASLSTTPGKYEELTLVGRRIPLDQDTLAVLDRRLRAPSPAPTR